MNIEDKLTAEAARFRELARDAALAAVQTTEPARLAQLVQRARDHLLRSETLKNATGHCRSNPQP